MKNHRLGLISCYTAVVIIRIASKIAGKHELVMGSRIFILSYC